jgi:ATP-dependent helicase/nuclease subunit B
MSSATLSELLDALNDGRLLLLPNARAARELRAAFDARQRMLGRRAWEPARALSWSQWTNFWWGELVVHGAESRLLLNAAQEHSVWREIIVDDPANRSMGSEDSLAELARGAWQLAAGYNATQRLRGAATSHDSRVFAGWAEVFSKQCAARGYLSVALLDAALVEHLEVETVAAAESLELVGFGEMLPSQVALLAGLRAHGASVVERYLVAEEQGLRAIVAAANEREELALAARWIRGVLKEPRAVGRDVRVAVLLPNLAEERTELEGVLRETLTPELQSVDADLSSTPWEFSGGVALSSLAMIADALALVRWMQGPLPLERVSSLLLSPYVGSNGVSGEDRDAVAQFDASRLRRTLLLRAEIDVSTVVELVESEARRDADGPALLEWLRGVEALLKRGDRSRARGFADWMEFVREVLQAANWPGERTLTATEFETVSAWESVLDMVSTLDFSGRRVSFASALQALELQTKKTIFAAPSTGAPVQVMSIAEAEGSVFDAVVFLHATDANWPALARVNPLLPWVLQRDLKMPGSDSALTAAKCRAFTEGLLKRAGRVLFTCAAEDADGKLRPSPLLREMQIEQVEASDVASAEMSMETIAVQREIDDVALPALPSHEVAGGASVLKLQAACGFLAFAQLRLRASEPESAELGLDAGESGSVLHRALQHFWEEVKTQKALQQESWAERDEALARAIDAALPRRLEVRDGWDRAYLGMLKQRLRAVLRQWLEEELRRGPFVVSAVERKELVTVGPLTLDVRVDRIDGVDGGVFLVDYKTGYAADPRQWDGPRPDEPQLPLYALLAETEELKGVAFAKVRAGREMKWQGYQAEAGILPVSRARNVRDLGPLVEQWRETLTRLAENFAAGRADVSPKSYAVNCPHCAQRLLCRFNPASANVVDDGGDEMEDGDE